MTRFLDEMEKILGAKIERGDNRIIPGMERTEGMDVIYFSDDGKNTPKKQFNDLIDSVEPRNAKSGGRNAEGCNITLPDGQLFYAMGCRCVFCPGHQSTLFTRANS